MAVDSNGNVYDRCTRMTNIDAKYRDMLLEAAKTTGFQIAIGEALDHWGESVPGYIAVHADYHDGGIHDASEFWREFERLREE